MPLLFVLQTFAMRFLEYEQRKMHLFCLGLAFTCFFYRTFVRELMKERAARGSAQN